MDALQVLKEGIVAAGELLALAIMAPAFGAEPARALHVESSRLEVAVGNGVVNLQVEQRLRNAGAALVDLAPQLPPIDDDIESLRVVRGSRSIDLAARDSECGGAFRTDEAAHVRLALDEAIADALTLPPGESVTIVTSTTRRLGDGARVERLLVPWSTPPAAAQILVDEARPGALMIVVPPAAARGPATLRLRPARGSAHVIELGSIEQAGTVFAVAIDRALLLALADGALELETRSGDELQWATLPLPAGRPAHPLVVDVQR